VPDILVGIGDYKLFLTHIFARIGVKTDYVINLIYILSIGVGAGEIRDKFNT